MAMDEHMNERQYGSGQQVRPAQQAGSPQQANAGQKPLVKRKRVVIPILFLVLAGIVVLSYWYLFLRGYVSTNDAYVDGDPVTVSSKILGRVTELAVDEGDPTTQGQLLVLLDDSDLRAQEAQSKAGLEYSQRNVTLAETNLERARDDFERASLQFRDTVITREQYDHAKQALQMAEAQSKVALSQVGTAKAQLGVVETQLKNTTIFSPITGVVAKKWVMPGDIVQPGQPIFTIYDLNNIWVTANLEETKLWALRLNDPVTIMIDTYPGREFKGKVILIGAAAASQFSLIPPNNASGNFTKVTQRVPIKISLQNSGSNKQSGEVALLPGMSAEVKIRVKSE